MNMKKCSKCNLNKSDSEFIAGKSKRYHCHSCQKQYVREHYKKNRKQYYERNKKRKVEVIQEVKLYLESKKCVDCNIDDIRVLEFDHVRGKKHKHLSRLIHESTWPIVKKEIEKCDVVCANCHRIRTNKQFATIMSWRK